MVTADMQTQTYIGQATTWPRPQGGIAPVSTRGERGQVFTLVDHVRFFTLVDLIHEPGRTWLESGSESIFFRRMKFQCRRHAAGMSFLVRGERTARVRVSQKPARPSPTRKRFESRLSSA